MYRPATLTVCALLASAALAAPAHAALLESWEGDDGLDGWEVRENTGTTATLNTDTGVTEGAQSVQLDVTASDFATRFQRFFNSDERATIMANDKLLLDITYDGPRNSLANQFYVRVNYNNSDGNTGDQSDTFTLEADTTQTFEFNYGDVAEFDEGTTFLGFQFGTNFTGANSDANTLYIDNLRVEAVPEPASLAVLGLGGSLLLLRRRRRETTTA